MKENIKGNKTKLKITIFLSILIFCSSVAIVLGVLFIRNHDAINKQVNSSMAIYENSEYTFIYKNQKSSVMPEEVKENPSNYTYFLFEEEKTITISAWNEPTRLTGEKINE